MKSTDMKIIHQGNTEITTEILPDYSQAVVIKKSSKHGSSRRIFRSLEKEYNMTRSLNMVEGVRKALELKSTGNELELILEYIDGETLQNLIKRNKINLRSKLEIKSLLTASTTNTRSMSLVARKSSPSSSKWSSQATPPITI